MLSRQDIFNSDDLVREKVKVPEWGGEVWVRTMSSRERDRFETNYISVGDNKAAQMDNLRARFVVFTVCDKKGRMLFKPEDADKLGEKSAAAMDRLFEVAQRLNHMGKEDVEGLAKNSKSGQSGDSGTV